MKNLAHSRLCARRAPGRLALQLFMAAAFVAIAIFSTPTASAQQTIRARNDFDGDSRTDLAVFRPSEGVWSVQSMTFTDIILTQEWGTASDVLVPGDYDNDGVADFAFWRPAEGSWYVLHTWNNTQTLISWGLGSLGDIPVQADYDGDGKTDAAVWRPSEGYWYILNSSDNTATILGWGREGDKPVPADYDGDGRADLAVWRPSEGNWYILNSSFGAPNSTVPQVTKQRLGISTDIVVPEDYDGDYKADLAVWRPSDGNWHIINSKTKTVTQRAWGLGSLGDIPVPGDFDDDFKADFAVWRPSEGNWYIIMGGSGDIENGGMMVTPNWGVNGDVPILSQYFH